MIRHRLREYFQNIFINNPLKLKILLYKTQNITPSSQETYCDFIKSPIT